MQNTTFLSSFAIETSACDDRHKILIVDGSSENRDSLAKMLGELALEIVEANDEVEALAIATASDLNLMIVGCNLNGLGAVRLCQTLKQAHGTQLLPVFMVTQTGNVDDEVRAIEAGADVYLRAPLHPELLRARVCSSLRQKVAIDSLDTSESALFSLAQSVEERDSSLGQHCQRLAFIVSIMGRALQLSGQDLAALQRAAYLHDIGKVSIPDSVLFKAGPLTPDEWEIMKSHAEKGERICSNIRSLAPVLPIIRHHHEKWNGSGYPDGLKGEEIPLLARILQLADIYDALTTSRCYKAAFTSQQAVEMMQEEAQKGWRDPQLTEVFAELVPLLSTVDLPDLSRSSLQALDNSLKRISAHVGREQLRIPGLYNTPTTSNQQHRTV